MVDQFSKSSEEVQVIGDISYKDFRKNYLLKRRPVVIHPSKRNRAAESWTPEYLLEKLQGKDIVITQKDGEKKTTNIEEVYNKIMKGEGDDNSVYLHNVHIRDDAPELYEEIFPKPVFEKNDWKALSPIPKDFVGIQTENTQLFFSGPAACYPTLHIDYWGMDGFIQQVYGEKEFILFHPEDSAFLYPSKENKIVSEITNIFSPDFEKYPLLKKARPLIVRLRPGDLLYNPGYWHSTRTISPSITLISSHWNKANWGDLISEYSRRIPNSAKKVPTMAYLKACGLVFPVTDWVKGLSSSL